MMSEIGRLSTQLKGLEHKLHYPPVAPMPMNTGDPRHMGNRSSLFTLSTEPEVSGPPAKH